LYWPRRNESQSWGEARKKGKRHFAPQPKKGAREGEIFRGKWDNAHEKKRVDKDESEFLGEREKRRLAQARKGKNRSPSHTGEKNSHVAWGKEKKKDGGGKNPRANEHCRKPISQRRSVGSKKGEIKGTLPNEGQKSRPFQKEKGAKKEPTRKTGNGITTREKEEKKKMQEKRGGELEVCSACPKEGEKKKKRPENGGALETSIEGECRSPSGSAGGTTKALSKRGGREVEQKGRKKKRGPRKPGQ